MKLITYTTKGLSLAMVMLITFDLSAFDAFDYNGDGVADIGLFRPTVGSGRFWYYPSGGLLSTCQFGQDGDIPLAADYDGDGKTDFAVYSPSAKQFQWIKSSSGAAQSLMFGDPGDLPVVGDFDGDGKTDVTIYRPSTKVFWWIRSSDNSVQQKNINGQLGDIPLANDYDGDGVSDFVVYRPTESASFRYIRSSDNVAITATFGSSGDMPLSGDFDGDNKADLAVYRPGVSTFYYIKSSNQEYVSVHFGDPGFLPIPGDYDGDGKTDIGVFAPANPGSTNQFWHVRSTDGGLRSLGFGDPGDHPLNLQSYEPSQVPAPTDTFVNSPAARQVVYQSGVPNTTKNGTFRVSLQADSYFPKIAYYGLTGAVQSGIIYNYLRLKNAGLNGVIPYPLDSLTTVFADAAANDIQVMPSLQLDPNGNVPNQISAAQSKASQYSSYPNLLGWLMEEEPTGAVDEGARWTNFQNLKASITQVDPTHAQVVLDTAWFIQSTDPTIAQEWNKWNAAGSVSCHDNYPYVDANVPTLDTMLGIPNSVKQAVTINNSGKPVWLTVQAFELPSSTSAFHWVMPTGTQLRAQIFAGLIHGATGIIYFAPDSYVTRAGSVIGMAPDTLQSYGVYMTATLAQVQSSKDLWQSLPLINAELERSKNALFSPTAGDDYSVAIAGPNISATPIRMLLKKRDNLYTLFVVNLDKATIKTKVTLSRRPADLKRVSLDGSPQFFAPHGAVVYDSFAPYESRVYQFK